MSEHWGVVGPVAKRSALAPSKGLQELLSDF